jgi:dTDP-4-amino-4,6-dideoxygalactose transaminase
MNNSYQVIKDFEQKVSEYTNAPYAIAVDSCASALQLCCEYHFKDINNPVVEIPKHTYISVPQAIIHAGGKIRFSDTKWTGCYRLLPYNIYDSARYFTKNMYNDIKSGDVCLSFHYRKILNLGKGGMILTDSKDANDWYRVARYSGRHEGVPESEDNIEVMGHNFVMTPDIAARGLTMMQFIKDNNEPLTQEDRDLSELSVFKPYIL